MKEIVVYDIYTDTQKGVQLKLKQATGLNNSLLESLVDKGIAFYASSYPSKSAVKAARSLTEVKQLYVLGKDAGDLLATTGEVYNQAMGYKETVEVPHSRIKILYKKGTAPSLPSPTPDLFENLALALCTRSPVPSPCSA